MSFEIGKIQQLTVPEHEQEITQKKRLAELGDLIAQYESSLKEFKITDIDVKKVKAELTVLTNELADKNSAKQYLQNEIAKANYELDGLKQQREEYQGLGEKIQIAKKNLAGHLAHVDQLNILELDLKESIKSLSAQHDQLVAEVGVARQSFEKVAAELAEQENNLKKNIDDLQVQVAELQKKSDELQTEVNTKFADISDLSEQINVKGDELANLKLVLIMSEQESQKKITEMERQKQEEWDKKDGDLSIREVWLADKIQQANAIKDELERTFNRKINIQF